MRIIKQLTKTSKHEHTRKKCTTRTYGEKKKEKEIKKSNQAEKLNKKAKRKAAKLKQSGNKQKHFQSNTQVRNVQTGKQ